MASTGPFHKTVRSVLLIWVVGSCLAAVAAAQGGVGSAGAVGALRSQDVFIAGYLTAVLERELGWRRGSYQLTVDHGVATITLPRGDTQRQAQLADRLPSIAGLQGVQVRFGANGGKLSAARRGLYSVLGVTPRTVPFPVGDLFLPILADPKQPQFFASFRYYRTPTQSSHVAAVGFGETFGLYRREGRLPGDGLQVSVSGALFGQFNLDTPSNDLVNADYTIGLPVTWRRRPWSARLRVYHQSSHLGDEYLLRAHPRRINLSFESLELLGAYRWHGWRAYGGGEYLFHREPADLKPGGLHAGLEYRGQRPLLWGGRLVAGLDLKSWQEHNYSVDRSLKVGLEFGATQPGRRRLRVMAEAYRGYAPHGQFYDDKLRYLGLGVYLGF